MQLLRWMGSLSSRKVLPQFGHFFIAWVSNAAIAAAFLWSISALVEPIGASEGALGTGLLSFLGLSDSASSHFLVQALMWMGRDFVPNSRPQIWHTRVLGRPANRWPELEADSIGWGIVNTAIGVGQQGENAIEGWLRWERNYSRGSR